MKYSKIVFLILLVISAFVVFNSYSNQMQDVVAYEQSLTMLYAERVQVAVNEAAQVTEVIKAVTILNNGTIPSAELEVLMKLAYKNDIHLAIAYMPDGIIQKTYPLEGNEASIGYNVFEDDAAKVDAIKAMESHSIVSSGPYMLMTGVPGLVARNPIFIDRDGTSEFWGFVASIIRPTGGFLKGTGILDLDKLGYEYRVSSIYSGNSVELYKSPAFDPEDAREEYNFEIGQGKWSISLYQRNAQKSILQNTSFIALAILAISSLIYVILRHVEIQHRNSQEQALTDPLTKLRNRRALELYAKCMPETAMEGYSIFYLDLNKFKPVNDTYGHDVGDILLQIFAERLVSNFKKHTFLARIGGDEFLVVIPEVHDLPMCEQISARILALSEDAFLIAGKEIHISCSIGYALYPKDGKSFNDVMAQADQAMFKYKEAHRKGR